MGLQAQATAFSDGPDGIINCLALLPQVNRVSSVSSRDDGSTEFDAIQRFCEMDHMIAQDYSALIVGSIHTQDLKLLCLQQTFVNCIVLLLALTFSSL